MQKTRSATVFLLVLALAAGAAGCSAAPSAPHGEDMRAGEAARAGAFTISNHPSGGGSSR